MPQYLALWTNQWLEPWVSCLTYGLLSPEYKMKSAEFLKCIVEGRTALKDRWAPGTGQFVSLVPLFSSSGPEPPCTFCQPLAAVGQPPTDIRSSIAPSTCVQQQQATERQGMAWDSIGDLPYPWVAVTGGAGTPPPPTPSRPPNLRQTGTAVLPRDLDPAEVAFAFQASDTCIRPFTPTSRFVGDVAGISRMGSEVRGGMSDVGKGEAMHPKGMFMGRWLRMRLTVLGACQGVRGRSVTYIEPVLLDVLGLVSVVGGSLAPWNLVRYLTASPQSPPHPLCGADSGECAETSGTGVTQDSHTTIKGNGCQSGLPLNTRGRRRRAANVCSGTGIPLSRAQVRPLPRQCPREVTPTNREYVSPPNAPGKVFPYFPAVPPFSPFFDPVLGTPEKAGVM